jgi:ATP-dependent Clp protease ATP-binding subunit ClpA
MATNKIGFADDALGGRAEAKKAIERLFSPEFRNRLDATVFFDPLPPSVIRRVVDKFLDEIDGQLAEKKVQLEVSDAAREWFAERGYDRALGARPMARLIQEELKVALADELLFGKLEHGGTAHVDAKDGKLVIDIEPGAPPEAN